MCSMSNQSPGRTWSLSVSNLIQHMTVELAQQVAGVGEKVSDSNEHETEKQDEDSDGDW
jgi:hypothetical protein